MLLRNIGCCMIKEEITSNGDDLMSGVKELGIKKLWDLYVELIEVNCENGIEFGVL